MPIYVTIPLCALTGATAFMMGALTQQDISYRRIKRTMVQDPYVYQCRAGTIGSIDSNRTKAQNWVKKVNGNPKSTCNTTEEIIGSRCGCDNDNDNDKRSTKDYSGSNRDDRQSRAAGRDIGGNGGSNVSGLTQINHTDEPPTPKLSHVADLMKYGFPGMDEIHVYKNFILSYDRRNRIAHWVCEHLNSDCLSYRDPKTLQKPNEYAIDPNIADMFSPSMKDFRNSDWVGGHMASPLNYKCDMDKFIESYIFPNIVPISRGLKNNVWLRLEHYVRELAMESGSVYVYTGPLFMPQRITFRNWAIRHHVMGMNTIAVPTHFFKVIISEERDALPRMEGYVVPNADIDKEMDLNSFMSDIRDIEHFAGLKFYDGAREEIMRGPRDSIDG
ncbi:uncharacterized protein Dwil_GK10249 [Drosophila willistoni]|uniref:Endonuclease G, mitochondrial n=1 Tax=Drosophila willistoni TaxID=7260 RepID=B4NDJ6_DROWI|nr:uncharacterized protein Dwil_GK10249 [Drosophila willistoni]